MSTSVTMKDVARVARVSLATVSKVMNGTGNVDPALRERVRAASSQLGYKPNYIAKLLKTSKTRQIHVILPNLSDQNFRTVFAGAEQVLTDHGYLVSLHLTSEIRWRENQFLEAALYQRAAGVILATCQPDDGTRIKELDDAGIRLVFIEREPAFGRYPYLDFDNRRLIRNAVHKLLGQGCASLVLLAGPKEFSSEAQAIRGFNQAMAEAGQAANGHILEANLDLESSFLAIVNHLGGGGRPDAVITTSMATYTSARKAVEMLGRDFPRPIRFVTLGHAGWADALPERTEVISRNSYRMGEEAARALMEGLDNPIANAGRYYCIETEEPPAAGATGASVRLRGRKGTLRLLLQCNSLPSIKPLLADFESRTGWTCRLDSFYYDDMFAVFDSPGRLEQYDILQVDQPVIAELSAAGVLARLDGILDRLPDLPDIRGGHPIAAVDIYSRYQGSVYAIPFRFGSQLLFYRSDLFDNPDLRLRFRQATNGELRPPRTWEEFNSIARFFTRAFNPDSPVEYGVSMGSHHYVGVISEFMPRLWAFGGAALDGQGRLALESRQAVQALDNYLESHQYASPASRDTWQNGQIADFNSGQSAMMAIFSAMAEHLVHRDESQVVGRVGFAQLPGGTPLLGGWSLGIRNGSPNMDAAVEWIRWITSERVAMPHTILGGANMAAMLRQNSELRSIYPWLSMALDSFRISRPHEVSAVATGGAIRFREFAMAFSQCVHEALRKGTNPETAMEKAVALIRGGRHAPGLKPELIDDAQLAQRFS